MNKTKFFFEAGQVAIVLSAVVLLTLIGCGRNGDAPSPGVQASSPAGTPAPSPGGPPAPSPAVAEAQPPPTVEAQSPPVVQAESAAFVAQDDYVYYPSYGIYYSSGRHQYASLEAGAWVSQPAPRGVSVDALRASPSVKMDFHDSPATHHAAIAQQYPKTWKPTRVN